ncbi:hypothetical protein ACSDQ9_08740 [Aestuariimicrobium soli]|uniref:hypothetical protein n=1 Tax=Aestuariimicrobium soli TaxID=2035834 RepID=UPI003EC05B20
MDSSLSPLGLGRILGVVGLIGTLVTVAIAIVAAVRASGMARSLCIAAAVLAALGAPISFLQGLLYSALGTNGILASAVLGQLVSVVAWALLCVAVMSASSRHRAPATYA